MQQHERDSSEHTELARKMGTDSQTDSRMTASGGGGLSKNKSRTQGQEQCGDCWGDGVSGD